jgi:ribose transport system permease protein
VTLREESVPEAEQQAAGTPSGRVTALAALRRVPNLGLVVVFVLFLFAGALLSPNFLTTSNFTTILTNAASIGIITIGMTFVIASGGIDLSVGAIAALASVWATTNVNQDLGWPVMVGVALLVGVGCGMVNGALIAYGRMVPFIATLAMLAAARGMAEWISGGIPQSTTDPTFNSFGTSRLLGMPIPVWVFAAVAVIAWVLLNRTTYGRRTVAIGGNAEASRLAGINVPFHKATLYMLSGLLCGVAAVLISARLTSGSNSIGELYELDAIAAAIIGGNRLSGGKATLVGAIIGVLIFTVITNIFVLRNLQSDIQEIAKGVIIVAAVLLQGRNRDAA